MSVLLFFHMSKESERRKRKIGELEKKEIATRNMEKKNIKERDTEKRDTEKRDTEKRDTEKRDTEKRDTEKRDTDKKDTQKREIERLEKRFDVIVIGAGSGLEISSYAADQGLSVAIIEEGPFGGTCLNRGCIPSKMLIHAADVMETISRAHLFGISANVTNIDWKKLQKKVFGTIDSEAKGIIEGNKSTEHITVYPERGMFVGPKKIQVKNEILTADKLFIAAGTRPFIPLIPGLDGVKYITSDQALRLKKQPKSITILGGGYIGCELAHFFGMMGTKVSIIHRNEFLMNNEDSEISKRFTDVYKEKYDVFLNAETQRVWKKDGKISVQIKQGKKMKTITSEEILIATGRVPNTDILNCKQSGISLTEKGFVKVNEFLETNVPGVFALGDIAGIYLFKHSANLEAEYAIRNAFLPKQVSVPYFPMPHAAFTSPQVAGVGYTEDYLKEKKIAYKKGMYEYKNTAYGNSILDTSGFVKVLLDSKTEKILGCHIMGTHASILIHEVIVAMKANLGGESIRNAIHIHPALSEVVQRAFWNVD